MTKFTAVFIAAAASAAVFAQDAAEEAVVLEEESGVEVYAGADFVSAYITDSGFVGSDSFNIQPNFGICFDLFDKIPVELDMWSNYSANDFPGQTQSSCFTEIDLSITLSWDFDFGTSVSGGLTTWQYPNTEGANGEELIALKAGQSFFDGLFEIGLELEYMISGDCEKDLHLLPYCTISYDFTENLGVALTGQLYYMEADASGEADGFANYNVEAMVILFSDFYAYVRYWGQIDDDVYTDEMHDLENVVYGAGFSFSF